jgi:hypothetical protein
MFSWFRKRKNSSDDLPELTDWEKTCPDCETQRGRLHDFLCTKERCPFCGGQLLTCECIREVLALGGEEQKAFDEYVDDSVEPLRSIMERWKLAVNAKGRIPFQPTILDVTPASLLLVSARGKLPFVRALLAKGIPIDAANEVGCTGLMAAARSYRLDVLAFLLRAGADVHCRHIDGHTPLHWAVSAPAPESTMHGQIQAECVRLLLKHGAEIDARTQDGGTPLMTAAWFGCAPGVDCLLQASADPTLRDNSGRTAQDLAHKRGHGKIADLLGEYQRRKAPRLE